MQQWERSLSGLLQDAGYSHEVSARVCEVIRSLVDEQQAADEDAAAPASDMELCRTDSHILTQKGVCISPRKCDDMAIVVMQLTIEGVGECVGQKKAAVTSIISDAISEYSVGCVPKCGQ